MRTRVCPVEGAISTAPQLIATAAPSAIQNQGSRCGGFLGASGRPRPSGAGATRQRPLSSGSGVTGAALFVSTGSIDRSASPFESGLAPVEPPGPLPGPSHDELDV